MNAAAGDVSFEIVQTGSHTAYRGAEALVRLISSECRLEEAVGLITPKAIGKATQRYSISLDFDTHYAILFIDRDRPSTGYSAVPAALELTEKGDLLLTVRVNEPQEGRMYAAILTNPFFLIKIPSIDTVPDHVEFMYMADPSDSE